MQWRHSRLGGVTPGHGHTGSSNVGSSSFGSSYGSCSSSTWILWPHALTSPGQSVIQRKTAMSLTLTRRVRQKLERNWAVKLERKLCILVFNVSGGSMHSQLVKNSFCKTNCLNQLILALLICANFSDLALQSSISLSMQVGRTKGFFF